MNIEERLVIHSSPPTPPPERKKFLRLIQVSETTGLSRTTIYRKIASREFPRQIHLGARSVAWVEAEVVQWMNDREQLSRDSERAD
jgi:prophage regulatory protein